MTARDSSFAHFQGVLGNAGHNLYVSAARGLQRIRLLSISGSGYVDLPFANSHDDDVRLPFKLLSDPLGHPANAVDVATNGAFAAVAHDYLTGIGYYDIVIACQYDGCSTETNSQICFGDAPGYGLHHLMELWAPSSRGMAAGDFDRSGRHQLVFVSKGVLQVFARGEAGFASDGFVDLRLAVPVESALAADLDGDGFDDLAVGRLDGMPNFLWGGPGGLSESRARAIDVVDRLEMTIETDAVAARQAQSLEAALQASQLTEAAAASWASTPGIFVEKVPATFQGPEDPGRVEAPGAGAVGLRGPFVQYRLLLGATNSVATPRVRTFELEEAS